MYSLIVTLVNLAKPTAADYSVVVKAVEPHMHPKPLELYTRLLFYKRDQHADKAVADYVTVLHKLAEDCVFGDEQLPLHIMMGDRFVCSLACERVQPHLLAEHSLTFGLAYDLDVTAEDTSQYQKEMAAK